MRRLLWVGDAGCESGFARATHHTLEQLRKSWDVYVLGLNFRGDSDISKQYPYHMYPAYVQGGDYLGIRRLANLVVKHRVDCVVIQNDPANFAGYLDKLEGYTGTVVGTIAMDGKNCIFIDQLNRLDRVLFWTDFARDECIRQGLTPPSGVVPLGVDLNVYKPGDKLEARKRMALPEEVHDKFIVGNINRNQPRKRFDLMIRYFCRWAKEYRRDDAILYLHAAPTGDNAYDCGQLMHYYGLQDRLLLAEPETFQGTPEHWVVSTLQSFDLQASTTQGEGWGLTTLEGMACRIPQIVPMWSALADWAFKGSYQIECTSTSMTPRWNVIGGVPDEEGFIHGLDLLYRNREFRDSIAQKGFELANEPRYRWENIGAAFGRELERALVRLP